MQFLFSVGFGNIIAWSVRVHTGIDAFIWNILTSETAAGNFLSVVSF